VARDQALKRLSETNLPIIFGQKWDRYNDAMIDYDFETEKNLPSSKDSFAKLQLAVERTLETFVARGHNVLIIGGQVNSGCAINRPRLLQGPILHAPEPPCPATPKEAAKNFVASIDLMLSHVQAKWPDKVALLRPVDYFCERECPVVKDGIWLYFDDSHFTVAGSKYMVTRAADVFRKFLATN
jgi:hypothetical protein